MIPTTRSTLSIISIILLATIHAQGRENALPTQDNCLERRAAFDVGSETTKMKVAEVNVCLPLPEQKSVLLFSQNEKVPYKKDLKASSDLTFSQSIMDTGITVLSNFKAIALRFNATAFAGVATSAFRQSRNAKLFLQRVEAEIGIRVTIIDHDTEGLLGFLGVATTQEGDVRNYVVWDIGGGTMQITAYHQDGYFIPYKGNLASLTMKEHVIQFIKGEDPQFTPTPNPISLSQTEEGKAFAQAFAHADVSPLIKKKLSDPQAKVIGIGALHNLSIGKQTLSGKSYTLATVEATLEAKAGATGKEIGGQYANTQISNLILVAGFMKALSIDRVELADVNLADGVLVESRFWDSP